MKSFLYNSLKRHYFVALFVLLSIFTTLVGSVTAQAPTNQPPVIGDVASQSLQVGQTISVPFSATDADGNPLTISVSSDNTVVASATQSGVNSLVVTANSVGSANIQIMVDDGQGGSASTAFTVTVNPLPTVAAPNQPPVIASQPDLTLQAGQVVSLTISASDPEGNLISINAISDNPNVALVVSPNPTTLNVTGVSAGIAHIVVSAADGQGLATSMSFAVTVNQAPTDIPTATPLPTEMPTLPATVEVLPTNTLSSIDATPTGTSDVATAEVTATVTDAATPQATEVLQPTTEVPMTSIIVRTAVGLNSDQQAQVIVRNGGVETSSVAVLRLHFIDVPSATVSDVIQKYRLDAQVVSVEIDKSREVQSTTSSRTPLAEWHFPKLAVRFQSTTSAVAILDTGIEATHPGLNGLVLPGFSAFEGGNAQTDANGHGTQMAGIVHAASSGANVMLMPVQVLDADGLGQDSDIINGIVWATDNGADVILMAFSNPGYSSALQAAIDYAWNAGVVLVAATGNDSLSSAMYPAGDAGVMGVSATDGNNTFAPFSNYGADVFLAAPGVNINTTDIGGGMTSVTGTSASAAYVAGAAALMQAIYPTDRNGVTVGKLARNADAVGTQSQTGNGQINVSRALGDTNTTFVKPLGVAYFGSGGPFVGPYKAATVTAATLAIKESTCTTNQSVFYTAYTVCASTSITTSGSGNNLRMQWYNPSNTLVQDIALSGVSNGATVTNTLALTGTNAAAGTWTVKTCATSTAGACSAANTKSTATFTVVTAIAPTMTVGSVMPSTSYSPMAGFVMGETGESISITANISDVGNGDDSVGEFTIVNSTSANKSPLSFQVTGTSGSGGSVTWGTPTVTNNTSNTSIIVFPYTGTLTTGTYTFTLSLAAITTYTADLTDSFSVTLERGTGGPTSALAAANTLKRYSLMISDITPPSSTGTVVGQTVTSTMTVFNYTSGGVGLTAANTSLSGSAYASTGTEAVPGSISSGKSGNVTYTSAIIAGTAGSQTVEGDAGKGTTVTSPHFSKSVTISPATLNITLTGDTPDPSTAGSAYAVTWSYTVASPGSGTPSGNITVTDGTDTCTAAISAGTCNLTSTTAGAKTLTATYGGDSNFTGSTASGIAHTVNKGTPTLTWANPSAITYGTALSGTQLNATASVPGTFVYSPVSGSVLNAGSQTLSVTFTPTDTTSYNTATKSVTLTVNKAALTITADNQSNQYGTALPILTASYSGFVNGDTAASLDTAVTLTTTATASSALGTYPITASGAADVNYTITFASGTMTVVARSFTLTLGSGTPNPSTVGQSYAVTWTYSITETGTGTPSGTVTISDGSASCNAAISAGTCNVTSTTTGTKTLTASYSSDTNFTLSSPATSSHIVNKGTPTITWANPSAITYGAALSGTQLNATASVPGTFVYTPASGTVLNAGTQTLHVDFTPTDTANYNTASKDVSLTVNKAATTTTIISAQPSTSAVGEAYTVNWTVSSGTPTGSMTVSDGTTTCSAEASVGSCLLTSTSVGTKTLTATYAGDSNYSGSTSAGYSHTVNKGTPTITWANPSAITYGTALSSTQLNATASVPGTFVYTPASGTVLNAGTQTLHVDFTPTDTTNYNTASKDVSLPVNKATTTTTIISAQPNTSAVGESYTVNWTVYSSGGMISGTVTVSDGTTTCNADSSAGSCSLTTTSVGTKTLTATYAGDSNHSGSTSAGYSHTVNKGTPTITWANPSAITYGAVLSSTQLNATASVPGTFVYTPASGTVLNAGTQTLHVDFTPTDSANYNTASKDVSLTVNKAATTTTIASVVPNSSVVGEAYTVNWTVNSGSGTPTGSVTVSDGTTTCSAEASVGSCSLTSTSVGTKTLTTTYAGDSNHSGSTSAGYSHTVNKATPVITWANPSAITYGTALSSTQLNATASVAGTFVYTPASASVLNAGSQTLHVDFTPTDSTNYNSVSKDVTLVVNTATITLSLVSALPNSSTVNQAYTVIWSTSVSDGTPVGTVTVSDGTDQCSVSVNLTSCTLTSTSAGTKTLSASYSGDNNYTLTAPATLQHTVEKATPVITWSNPADIVHGSALGSTQLNATASVPGTLVYSPAAGTVLNVGVQTLHVDFTPTDTANYNSNSKDVSINVVKADSITTIFNDQPSSTVVGQSYAVTWVVSHAQGGLGTPTGTVTVSDGTDTCSANVSSGTCNLVSTSGGTKTLVATYSGDSNFNGSVSSGHNHTVQMATPVITWDEPAALTYGRALSEVELNATASVPGTFVYTPAVGTVLDAGRGQTLHVDFTPDDTANYTSASKDVTIDIESSNIAISIANSNSITNSTVVGQSYKVSWIVYTSSGVPTGTVTVSDATDSCTADIQVGSCDLTSSTTGVKLLLAYYSGDNGFESSVSSIRLHKVEKATPIITWANPETISYGIPLTVNQLNATANVAGTMVYTPVLGTILDTGDQTLHVEFTPADSTNYNSTSKDVSITVHQAATSIAISNNLSTTSVVGEPYTVRWTLTLVDASSQIPSGTVTVSDGTDTCSASLDSGSCDLTSTTVGDKTLVATYGGSTNFIGSVSAGVQHSIAKASVALNWSNPVDITYGTALGADQLNATASVPGTFVYTPASGTVLQAANDQILHVEFVPTNSDIYASAARDVVIHVKKAPLTIAADNQSKVYGAELPVLSLQYDGFVNGDSAASLDTAATASTYAMATSNVGTYLIHVGDAADSNYQITYVNGALEITPLSITVISFAQGKTYGDADPTLTYTHTPDLIGSDAFSGEITRAIGEDVGLYKITQGSLTLSDNYRLIFETSNLTISPLEVNVSAQPANKVYGQNDPQLAYHYSPELVTNDAFSGNLSREEGESVGQYAITQGSLELSSNYRLKFVSESLVISPLAVSVTAAQQSKIYGQSDPVLSYTFSPALVGSDQFTGSLGREAGEDVGSYAITAGDLAVNSNYTLTFVGNNLSVNPLSITVTANEQVKTYGDADPALTYSYVPELVGSDAFSGELSRAAGEDVGQYAIEQGTLALSSNYTLTYVGKSLTIDPLEITVTANTHSKTYGDADPALTYTYSPELVGSDVFSGELSRAAGENVGQYAIKQGTLALGSNYSINYVEKSLTVNPLEITVTADEQSKTYGDADPTLTYSYSPELVSGDAFSGELSREAGEDVGSYAITQGTLALSNNYSINYGEKSLSIDVRAITVTADEQSKTYGDADPALTYSYTPELVSGDAFSGELTRDAGENVGQYVITQGTLALSGNYSINYVEKPLNIDTRTITVTANEQGKTYGGTESALTYSYTPELVSRDAFSGELTREAGENVGQYAITQGTLALSSNYSINYVEKPLTINPLAITVTADEQSKTYGDADPSLTYKYSPELVSGDSFSGELSRAAGENAGQYAIMQGTLALSGNYSINYVQKSLSIGVRTITVIADEQSKTYGEVDPKLTYSYSPELVSGDAFSGELTREAGENVGGYAITQGTLALSSNYSIDYGERSLSIDVRAITVTADEQSKSYGDTDPSLTYTYSPELVSGDAFSGELSREAGEDVGQYAISQGMLALSSNYSINYVEKPLTINPLAITVTANEQGKTYGDADPNLTYSYSPELVSGDAFSGELSRAAGEDVGQYAITQGTLALSSNYSINYVQKSLTVNPLLITVTADEKSKTYGEADPALSYRYSPELVNSDSFTGELTREASEDVGQYAITQGTLALSSNYSINYVQKSLTISPLMVTVTVDEQNKTYGEADPTLTYTYSPELVSGDAFSGELSRVAGEDVGQYAITQGTLALSSNYTVNFVSHDLTIDVLLITVTADGQTKLRRAADPQLTYTYSPELVNNDQFSGQLERAVGELVGQYAIIQGSLSLSSNYSLSFVGNTLKIEPYLLNATTTLSDEGRDHSTVFESYNVSWNVVLSVLDGTTPTGTMTVSDGTDTCSADIASGSCVLTSTSVGDKLLVATYSGDDEFNSSVSTGLAHVVDKATPIVNWDNPEDFTYGTALGDVQLNASASLPGSFSYTPSIGTVLDAGMEQTLHVEFTPTDSERYNSVSSDVKVNVLKAALTITGVDQTTTYGSDIPVLQAEYNGFVNGDTADTLDTAVSINTPATNASDVGHYPVTVSEASDTNYDITLIDGTLTIKPLTIMVTADTQSKAYGDDDPALTYHYSPELPGNDSFAGGLERAEGEMVGNYSINQGTLELGSNYELKYVDSHLTITKALITVTANDVGRLFGDPNPAFTASYSGFKMNETLATSGVTGTPVITTSATAQSSGLNSPYKIHPSLGTLVSDRYDFVFVDGLLNILPVIITPNNQTRTYGSANPQFAVSYSNFGGGQTLATSGIKGGPSCTTTATATSPIGDYPITCTTGTLSSPNHRITFGVGTLTVTKAPLSIVATNATREYGAANSPFVYSYVGFKNGETLATSDVKGTPEIITTATSSSAASRVYPITPTVGTLTSSNYSFTFVNGLLTITRAPLTVISDPVSRVYGEANPVFTVSYSGFKNNETLETSGITGKPTCSTVATILSPAANYTITCTTGTLLSQNYSFTIVNRGLTITKALVTVRANSLTRPYGTANPTLSVSYTGFKNGQNMATSGIKGAPALTTAAALTSSADTYPITAALGTLSSTNYSFEFVNGSLAVTKGMITVTALKATRVYGDANPALTVTYSGFMNGQTLATSGITGAPSVSTTATVLSPASTTAYVVTPTQGTLSSNNYSFTFVNGSITVTKAAVNVMVDSKSRVYGDANPTFTVAYTGLKNGETFAGSGTTGNPVCTTTATVASSVGSYPITCSVSSLVSSNYTFSSVASSLSITKAPLTLTAVNKSRNYGTANPTFTVTYSGFKSGQTLVNSGIKGSPVCSTTATQNSLSGSYPITCSVGTMTSTNYSFSFISGELTILPR